MRTASSKASRSGMTLMELVMVLVILVALAGILVPMMSGVTQNAQQVTTLATMTTLRNAVLQYYQDMKGIQVWTTTASGVAPGATGVPLTLRDLQIQPLNPSGNLVQSFSPVTQRGWRGPYLTSTTGTFLPSATAPTPGVSLDASFYPSPPAGFPSFAASASGYPYSYTLTYLYGNPPPLGNPPPKGDIAFLDGWGNPIVLQWPAGGTGDPTNPSNDVLQRANCVRLVSAGPPSRNAAGNYASEIDIPLTDPSSLNGPAIPSKASRANPQTGLYDNIVLFVLIQDPTP